LDLPNGAINYNLKVITRIGKSVDKSLFIV
jgi:hypothetical protein